MRYEATVGAGLPIIDTFHKLDETGDRVLRIDGCVSGTLMFVLSEVSAGRPFSEAVREAVRARLRRARSARRPVGPGRRAQGPDPGAPAWAIAAPAPTPDDLVPRVAEGAAARDVHGAAAGARRGLGQRVAREAAHGRVLRYVVTATAEGRLREAGGRAGEQPDGRRHGTRNLVSFTTRRYRDEPLVISGPGAGADVTAAGILNDICSLSGR